jgi:imidazolonepropionase-like amidohydrolase
MTLLLRCSTYALVATLLLPSAAAAQVTAVRAGRVVDPETGTAAMNQVILVENGRITAVGGNVTVPRGATVIDLSRATVLPGLFDAHAHLCMSVQLRRDAGSYYLTTLRDPDSYRAVQGVANARAMLEAGFTTVRDIGNEGDYACTSVRWAIERGLVPGPTMINAGRIIAPYGGQFHLQPDRRDLAEPEYFFADSRDEMRRGIRENVHFGAGVIKIVVDDQSYIYSTEDIRFMVEEARAAGLKLAAHVWTQAGAHNAAVAGDASLEHLNGTSDEDLGVAKANGTVAVFTPFPLFVLNEFRLAPGQAEAEYRAEIDRLAAAHRIGVAIAFGSDAIHVLPGYTRGTQAMMWIDSYVDAGLPPRAILQAMTSTTARLLGVDHERGAIRVGLAADLIAVPGDPLADIQTLKQVMFVMKDGRVIRSP